MLHPSSTIAKILILTTIFLPINLSAEQTSTESIQSSMDLTSTAEPMETTTGIQNSISLSTISEQIENVFTTQSLLASTSQAQIFTETMETTTDNEPSSIVISSTTTVMPTTTASTSRDVRDQNKKYCSSFY